MIQQDTAPVAAITPTTFEGRRVIVHRIGDVRVTIDMPIGCPQPNIHMHFHPGNADSDPAAARDALGLAGTTLRMHDGTTWYAGETADGRMNAAVFLP